MFSPVTRVPLMQGLPAITAGSREMRSNSFTSRACGGSRASDFRQLLTSFVVTPHCKNSNDPVRFQHLVDEAMLNIDAP